MWKKKLSKDEEKDLKNSGSNPNAPATNGEKEEEIEESLAEIYEDENGEMVNVKKFDIKKRRGILFWSAILAGLFLIAGLGGWLYYDYFNFNEPSKNNFILEFKPSKDKLVAGEEFDLKIIYKNMEKVAARNLEMRIAMPENFILTSASPENQGTGNNKNYVLKVGGLDSKRSGEIILKGKILAKPEDRAVFYAEAGYFPENFSSEFKKSASFEIGVSGPGIEFNFDNFTSALAGEENELGIKFKKGSENFISDFTMLIEAKNNNLEILAIDYKNYSWLEKSLTNDKEWKIKEATSEERQFPIKFKITEKKADQDEFKLKMYNEAGGIKYQIYEKTFAFEVIKGNLSLNLIINGSKNDQGISLGEDLNYLLSFTNKGETALKDMIIMAVIEGDIIDWASLKDEAGGKVSGNTISWSKNEIPSLESFEPNQEADIEFQIKIKDRVGQKTSGEIKSFAKYNVTGAQAEKDNISNTIIGKINSQLVFTELVRYFNEDNIAVGSGPIPPKAGETTAYKVDWTIGGNIHELTGTVAVMILPEGVNWTGKSYTNIGSINYNESERKVSWNIGRLPVIGTDITADFSISITPGENERNKVMVLSSGSKASGLDTETNSVIENSTKPKTTKLEDDEIGASDGVVR